MQKHDILFTVPVFPERKIPQAVHKGDWSEDEHQQFMRGIIRFGPGKWKQISQMMNGRTAGQCQIHYFKLKQKLGMTD